jgi:hypothetical protein
MWFATAVERPGFRGVYPQTCAAQSFAGHVLLTVGLGSGLECARAHPCGYDIHLLRSALARVFLAGPYNSNLKHDAVRNAPRSWNLKRRREVAASGSGDVYISTGVASAGANESSGKQFLVE